MNTEEQEAILIANKALDVPNADPDDDLRTISRQFLRLKQQLKKRDLQIADLKNVLKELIPIGNDAVSLLDEYQHNWEIVQKHKSTISKARKLL